MVCSRDASIHVPWDSVQWFNIQFGIELRIEILNSSRRPFVQDRYFCQGAEQLETHEEYICINSLLYVGFQVFFLSFALQSGSKIQNKWDNQLCLTNTNFQGLELFYILKNQTARANPSYKCAKHIIQMLTHWQRIASLMTKRLPMGCNPSNNVLPCLFPSKRIQNSIPKSWSSNRFSLETRKLTTQKNVTNSKPRAPSGSFGHTMVYNTLKTNVRCRWKSA